MITLVWKIPNQTHFAHTHHWNSFSSWLTRLFSVFEGYERWQEGGEGLFQCGCWWCSERGTCSLWLRPAELHTWQTAEPSAQRANLQPPTQHMTTVSLTKTWDMAQLVTCFVLDGNSQAQDCRALGGRWQLEAVSHETWQRQNEITHHYLQVKLEGDLQNTFIKAEFSFLNIKRHI